MIKLTINIAFLECILAFIGGMIFHHELYRWEKEPRQVVSCFFCMIFLILTPRILVFLKKL